MLEGILGKIVFFFVCVDDSEQVVSLDASGIQPELLLKEIARLLKLSLLDEFLCLLQFRRILSYGGNAMSRRRSCLAKRRNRAECQSENCENPGNRMVLLGWSRGATPHLQMPLRRNSL